mgnify:CR=1 FL=1
MKSIALRFSEKFAPPEGTIAAHNAIICEIGHVWYGKLGSALSDKTASLLMNNEQPRILLIHSGRSNRYWAYIDAVQRSTPPLAEIPAYYRHMVQDFKFWFRIVSIEKAENDVMQKCKVTSSGETLTFASKSSMSPYFIIDAPDPSSIDNSEVSNENED